MANYGISFYGQSTYGAAPFIQLDAAGFTAEPRGYDALLLSWSNPYGVDESEWDQIRLVRSSYGFPASPWDGITLFEDPKATARTSYLDNDGLQPGRFYYYTLFARLVSDGTYRMAGRVVELVPGAHGNGESLWDYVPQFYKERDEDYRGVHDNGPLRRFLGMLGYQLDRLRTEVDTLGYVADIDRVSGGLLPVLAESLGVTYEPELGMRISRGIVKNAIHLNKIKGTTPGVEGVASAYTAFGATAVVGKNLLLDKNASGFIEPTASTWTVAANTVLTPNAEVTYSPPVAETATLTAAAVADGNMTFVSGLHADRNLVPVTAGSTYTASIYTMHLGTARTVTVSLVYYDFDGVVTGTFTGTAAANTAAWVRRSVTGLAPANTVWAAIGVTVSAALTGEAHLFGAAQVEAGNTATTWESAREVHLYMAPERTNLVPNPSAETNVNTWSAINAAVSRSTAQFYDGTASFALTASVTGNMGMQSATANVLPVAAGEPFTLTAYFRPSTTVRNVRVSLDWFSGGSSMAAATDGTAVTEVAGTWTRARASGTAPAGADAVRAVVTVLSANGGETHYVDAVLGEQTEFVKDYFDAGQAPAENFLWAGTAHASASYFYPRRDMKNYRLVSVVQDYLPAGTTISTHYGQTAPASAI